MSNTTARPRYRDAVKFAWRRSITLGQKLGDLGFGAVVLFLFGMFALHAPLPTSLLASVLGGAVTLLLHVLNVARSVHMNRKQQWNRQMDVRPTFGETLAWVWRSNRQHWRLFTRPVIVTSVGHGVSLVLCLLLGVSVLPTLFLTPATLALAFALNYLLCASAAYKKRRESWDAGHPGMSAAAGN